VLQFFSLKSKNMNNFISAFKNLPRRGQHNLAKIICLGFGLAVSSVLIAEVFFEQTYDTWFAGHERTYQINEAFVQNGEYKEYSNTSGSIAPGIKAISPQVEAATRYTFALQDFPVEVDNRNLRIYEIYYADSCFFQVFPCKTVQGNLTESLSRPNYCVISRSLAERIGQGSVIGKVIHGSKENFGTLTIGGVYEDFPYGSSLHGVDILMPISMFGYEGYDVNNSWVGTDRYSSFIRLKPGVTIDDLKPNVKKLIAMHPEFKEAEKAGVKFNFTFTQITEAYTSSDIVKTMCWIMTLLAIILLVATVANYLLIVMGNIISRFREMAVRKCFGAERGNIYGILISESLLHVLLAIVLAALLLFACKGKVEDLCSAPLSSLLFTRGAWIQLAICAIIVVIGGLLPGWLYNKIPVTAAFRGVHEGRRRWKLIILSVEFLIVTIIFSTVAVISLQYHYLTHEELGYDYDPLAIVAFDNPTQEDEAKVINLLHSLPYIKGVTTCDNLPVNGCSGNNIYLPGDDKEYFNIADQYSASDGYLKLMGMKVVEGRNFTEPADSNLLEVMVDEKFVKTFQQATHLKGSVVGRRILISEHSDKPDDIYTICGVYNNIKIGSALYRDERPSVLFHSANLRPYIIAKFSDLSADNLNTVRQSLQQLLPDKEVSVKPYSMAITNQYTYAKSFREGTLVTGITALIIALMGLIGYTTDEVNRRRKEIAIRKVNGATGRDIGRMLVADVLKLSLPAVLIGLVVAWIISVQWLQLFADRITLNPLVFLAVAVGILLAVVAILLLAARKVINGNPVLFLKDE
jgi:putative ABC transport system permease protein